MGTALENNSLESIQETLSGVFETQDAISEAIIDEIVLGETMFTHARVMHALGEEFNMPEHLKKAAELYEESISNGARTAEAFTNLAVVYNKLNNTSGEWNALNEALRIDPENKLALFNKAHLLRDQGDFEGAISILQDLLMIDSENENARSLLEFIEEESANHVTLEGGGSLKGHSSDPVDITKDPRFKANRASAVGFFPGNMEEKKRANG